MLESENYPLVELLTQQGCTDKEIERVLIKLGEFDERTTRESVFDSIATGSFNLKAIIAEARSQDSAA